MTPEQLFDQVVRDFRGEGRERRRFSAGMAIAFIDLLSHLGIPGKDLSSFDEVLKKFPRIEVLPGGERANTLSFNIDGKKVGLRRFYNAAERFFYDNKRFDYPSCAPHATGQWHDYQPWLDALVTFSEAELAELRTKVCDFVLAELPSQKFDPTSVPPNPPLFRLLLEEFDLSHRAVGEPTGAAYQGVAFGFIRADNPHLQIEIDKVRTGSARRGRIADVDGWDGARLAISAEVKQYGLKADDVAELAAFANEVQSRGAIGMVMALSFDSGAREAIDALGVQALDLQDLRRIVTLWDPLKQRTAVQSMVYYVEHVERNTPLAQRLNTFLTDLVEPPKPQE